MGRPGVTYRDVAMAAATIAERGENPTVARVIHEMGTGSTNVVNRYLRQWKERNAQSVSEAETGLPADLVAAVKALYDGMRDRTDALVREIRTKAEADIDAARHETLDAQRRIKSLSSELDAERKTVAKLSADLDSVRRTLNDVRTEVATVQAERDAERRRIQDLHAEIERLDGQLQQAQGNLEHYREATRVQREQERAEAAERLRAVDHEVRKGRRQITQLQAIVARLEGDNERLREDAAMSDKARHAAEAVQQRLVADVTETRRAAAIARAEARGRMEAMEKARREDRERISALEIERDKLRKRIIVMEIADKTKKG